MTLMTLTDGFFNYLFLSYVNSWMTVVNWKWSSHRLLIVLNLFIENLSEVQASVKNAYT